MERREIMDPCGGVALSLTTKAAPQGTPEFANVFVGHILDDKYTLSALVWEDLGRQERLYRVSSPIEMTDATIFAKEFCLTNVPPKLYKSRRRNIRNFANKRNVLSCTNYCGKKFIVFDLAPKEVEGKGKGKALDPDLGGGGDDDDDEAADPAQRTGTENLRSEKLQFERSGEILEAGEPAGQPLDVDEKKSQHHRRHRPRHKRRRAKSSGTTDAPNSPEDQNRLSSLPRIHRGKVTYKDHSSDEESQVPVVEEAVQPNKEEKWRRRRSWLTSAEFPFYLEIDESLVRAANEILGLVAENHSEKFKKSNFFGLMRRIGNREVVVEGPNLVDASTRRAVISMTEPVYGRP